MERRIYRCPEQGKIAGVCYGLAEYFTADPVLVRLAMFLLLFCGPGLLLYIIAWIIVPTKESLQ
jgi:phage shock protein C